MHKQYTFCRARGCLFSDCVRAKKPEDENAWFFSDEPFRIVDGKFDCGMYVSSNQINMFSNEEARGDVGEGVDGGEENPAGED